MNIEGNGLILTNDVFANDFRHKSRFRVVFLIIKSRGLREKAVSKLAS